MHAELGQGQQNCGDPEMTQAVGTTFAKPWGKRGLLGFTEVHVSEELEMRLMNFILESLWS